VLTATDLTDDAHILYSSDSIVDILGHTPDEVVNRSVWQFFHPEELHFARAQHNRGVRLDKAAVLSYCRLKNRQGDWIGCECCFSIVYDVMVCCTSVYRDGMQSQSKHCLRFDVSVSRYLPLQSELLKPPSYASCSPRLQRIRDTTCCRICPASSISALNARPMSLALRFS
jgi:PAS domain S-box-containing protein